MIAYQAILSIMTLLQISLSPSGNWEDDTHANQNHSPDEYASPALAVRTAISSGALDDAEHLLKNIHGNEYAKLSFQGIIALKRQLPKKAIAYFNKAAKLNNSRPELKLLLAQAWFHIGDLHQTLTALKQGEPAGQKISSYYQFRGGVEVQLALFEEAWSTFNAGYQRFPQQTFFLKELAVVMIRVGLYTTAVEYGRSYLQNAPNDATSILVVAHALLKCRRFSDAAIILEDAVHRMGNNVDLLVTLAAAYGHADKPLAAARILLLATNIDNSYAFDAAQYYIAAQKWRSALNMNMRVVNPQKRLAQRLRIFFQQGRFSRAIATGTEMEREGLLTDDVRYCLVHAWLQLGNFDLAASISGQIKDKKWRKRAIGILNDMHHTP